MTFRHYRNIVEPFLEICEKDSEHIAIEGPNSKCSYRQLNHRSGEIALQLRESGIVKEDRVGICLRRDIDFIATIIAIHKLGAAYVPMDPDYPTERLRFYADDSGLKLLVTKRQHKTIFSGMNIELLDIDSVFISELKADAMDTERIEFGAGAYLMYTSGSTGKPKGVLVGHHNLLFSTEARMNFYPEPMSRYLVLSSFSFDSSVAGIFWALCSGSTLVLPEQGMEKDLFRLADYIDERSITHVLMLPSLYKMLINEYSHKLKSLNIVILAGEALNGHIVEEHFQHLPQVKLYNEYGPTECTVWSTVYHIPSTHKGERVPIGKAIPGATLLLMDKKQNTVEKGRTGEIYIGGPGVTDGYLGRRELNRRRFIDWEGHDGECYRLYRTGDLGVETKNGDIEFLGRTDQQVKVRGFRIELGEVEAMLTKHSDVANAVVDVRRGIDGNRLVAYLVPENEKQITVTDLRRALTASLPEYMVPTAYVFLSSLPRTPNGKIDRKQLPEPDLSRPEMDVPFVEPKNKLQKWLAALWSKYLQLERVGIKDRFLELGGTSLIAARIINDVQKKLSESVFVVALFNAPTIEEFAGILERDYQQSVAGKFYDGTIPRRPGAGGKKLSSSDFIRFESIIPNHAPDREGAARNGNRTAVFILSPPRSGTTLLQVMLAGHPGLYTANELQLLGFSNLAEMFSAYTNQYSLWTEGLIRCVMNLYDCGPDEARRQLTDSAGQGVSTADYFGRLQNAIGDRLVVDKSPSYALDLAVLDHIERVFSKALYIHLTRHPFAMVESFAKMHMDQVMYLKPNDYDAMQMAELIWTISHINIMKFSRRIPEKRLFRVQFEELVSSPEKTMRSLCRNFNWKYYPEMADPYQNIEEKVTDGIYPDSKPMGDPLLLKHGKIKADIADRWRGILDNDILSDETWKVSEQMGYMRPEALQSEAERLALRRRARRETKRSTQSAARTKTR